MDEFLTKKQLADLLHVAVRTVCNWEAQGRGPERIKVAGSRVLYERKAVEDWLESYRDNAPDAA